MSDGDTAMDETKEPAGVDEKLYSRQLYVMGHEGQRQMAASNVLICGLDGVGVEIAKNVILAGVKSVTLLDDTPASWMDMGAQFYVREADLGQPRAAVPQPRLPSSTRTCPSTCAAASAPRELVSAGGLACVVLCGAPLATQLEVDAACRAAGSRLVVADACGLFAPLFVDFGDAFVVHDTDGEQPVSCVVASITQDARARDGARRPAARARDGRRVQLSCLEGMGELSGREFAVEAKGPYSFEIDADTSAARRTSAAATRSA